MGNNKFIIDEDNKKIINNCNLLAKGAYQVVFKIKRASNNEKMLINNKTYILKMQEKPYDIKKYKEDKVFLKDLDYIPKIYYNGKIKFDQSSQISYNYIVTEVYNSNFDILSLSAKLYILKQLITLLEYLVKNDHTLIDLKIENIGYENNIEDINKPKLILIDYDSFTLCKYENRNNILISNYPWILTTYPSLNIIEQNDLNDKILFLNTYSTGLVTIIIYLLYNKKIQNDVYSYSWISLKDNNLKKINNKQVLDINMINKDIEKLKSNMIPIYTEIDTKLWEQIIYKLLLEKNVNLENILKSINNEKNVNNTYYKKYIKYKTKYLKLKN
jgi:hypothetical protein